MTCRPVVLWRILFEGSVIQNQQLNLLSAGQSLHMCITVGQPGAISSHWERKTGLVVSLIYRNRSLYSLLIPASFMVLRCVFSGDIHMLPWIMSRGTGAVDAFWEHLLGLLWKFCFIWISQIIWKNMHNPQIWGQKSDFHPIYSFPNSDTKIVPNALTIKSELTQSLEAAWLFLASSFFFRTFPSVVKKAETQKVRWHHPILIPCAQTVSESSGSAHSVDDLVVCSC